MNDACALNGKEQTKTILQAIAIGQYEQRLFIASIAGKQALQEYLGTRKRES